MPYLPLPATLTCWSGRGDGGHHLYFRRPLGRLTSTRLPAGIDLNVNGYLVVPPSTHPATGDPYRWEGTEMQPMPTALVELLTYRPKPRPVVSSTTGGGRQGGLVRFVRTASEGSKGKSGRNNALYWAARRAGEEGILDAIHHELRQAALDTGLTEREVDRTLRSAANPGGGAA